MLICDLDRAGLCEGGRRALAAIASAPGMPYALESDLLGGGTPREALVALYDSGLADVVESTGDGDYLPEGSWWTLTPLGACLAGVRLIEYQDECPVWGPRLAPDPPSTPLPRARHRRRIDVTLAWVETLRAERARRLALDAERAREALQAALSSRFWGGRRRPRRRRKPQS